MYLAIDIRRVLAGAIVFPIEKAKTLAKALCIPFAISIFIDLLSTIDLGQLSSLFLSFVSLAISTVFAITTHRLILMGEHSVPEWGLNRWTKRESYFLIHSIILSLGMAPVAILLLIVASIGGGNVIPLLGVVLSLLYFWIVARCSLVFPAIAVDEGVSFKLSWQLSGKHQQIVIVMAILFPILITLPMLVFAFVPFGIYLAPVLSNLVLVFVVSALSVSYLEIRRIEYGQSNDQ